MRKCKQSGQSVLLIIFAMVSMGLWYGLVKLNQTNTSLSKKQISLETELRTAEQTISTQVKEAMRYAMEFDQLKQQLNALSLSHDQLKMDKSSMERDYQALQQAFDQMEARESDFLTASEMVTHLKKKINLAHLLLAESDVESQDAALRQAQLERELQRLSDALHSSQLEYSRAQNQLQALDKQVVDLTESLADMTENLEKERHFNSALVVNEELQANSDLQTILRERERLIASNKSLVLLVSQLKLERIKLEERIIALEQDLLLMSQRLRESNLSYMDGGDAILADVK